MLLSEYFISFRQAIEKFDAYGFAEFIDISEETRIGKQGIIKI